MQRSALCRSRRELSNAYLLAKFGFDTAENEPCQRSEGETRQPPHGQPATLTSPIFRAMKIGEYLQVNFFALLFGLFLVLFLLLFCHLLSRCRIIFLPPSFSPPDNFLRWRIPRAQGTGSDRESKDAAEDAHGVVQKTKAFYCSSGRFHFCTFQFLHFRTIWHTRSFFKRKTFLRSVDYCQA